MQSVFVCRDLNDSTFVCRSLSFMAKMICVSLTTKFNTTIQIDPPYPQRRQLQAWVTENRQYLPPSLSEVHPHYDFSSLFQWMKKWYLLVPIANIDLQQDGQTFTIEAKITFPINLKKFYMLVCSNCGQDVRYPIV